MKYFSACLTVLLLSTPVLAQDAAQTWNDLDFSDLSTVYVLDDQGALWTGKLLRLDIDGLDIVLESGTQADGQVGQERHFAIPQVQRLSKRRVDSLKNGTLIGLSVGVGLPVLANAATLAVGLGPIGAAIGLGIDALFRGEQQIIMYEASGRTSTGRHQFSSPEHSAPMILGARFSW